MDNIWIKSNLYDYEVEFGTDFENELRKFSNSTFFVVDKEVYQLYQDKLAWIDEQRLFLVTALERNKTMDSVLEIVQIWKQRGVKKNWKIVCVGGGITQDLVTFASNIYLRNIEWIFFPTTLLSMCDSCIGGKCGINLGEYKNQLGVFYPPQRIYIDTEFINTLSEKDIINGWGEILKFSLTEDNDFFGKIEQEECIFKSKIDEYIYAGLLTKKKIIEEDEFEGDHRRVLNYGHTFGHALEAYTHNDISHGTAVIWGIDVVNYIAVKEGLLEREQYLRIKRLIKACFLQEEIVIDNPTDLYAVLSTDKKVRDNTIHLALLDHISNLIIYPMQLDDKLLKYFIKYLEETHDYYCC